ncbi:MAG: class I SAM-dependent methyltransferase [bacterium]|nr:class I SAM-dependent methyltransferase [bacterium]
MLEHLDEIGAVLGKNMLKESRRLALKLKADIPNESGKQINGAYVQSLERAVHLSFPKSIISIKKEVLNEVGDRITKKTPILDILRDRILIPAEMLTSHGFIPHALLHLLISASSYQLQHIPENTEQQQMGSGLLRLGDLLPPITYDQLHRQHRYLFMDREQPNLFVDTGVEPYRNGPDHAESLIEGKDVVVLGSGYGSDDLRFLQLKAASVTSIDDSPYARERLRERRDQFNPKYLRKRLILPEEPVGMFEFLEQMIRDEKQTDTIYAHSCFHYFDNQTFERLMSLIRQALKPGGHLAFAIKLPGASYDGEGIALIRDEKLAQEERDLPRIYKRVWLNGDSQIRFFRDLQELIRLINSSNKMGSQEAQLQSLLRSSFDVIDYDTAGQGTQPFAQLI